ncbi:pentraxin-related protein PTX3-like [Stegostoma tigrinum]|uniref:pentraxin-related protein PTX3-like n=1 Tax=Stegostoma tigrinum TaxID=3053191 RepID=UPI00202B849F|nr:pentraxin-related protein PTX3-like [Stegostoma tigrinum]
MSRFCLLLLAATLCCLAGYEYQGDDNFLFYTDSLEDSHQAEAEACLCHKDLSRLDKVFVMLEDSQMRQNMLLHSVDEVLAAELRAMRSEVQQALAEGTEACRHAHHHQKDTGSARFAKLLELAREGAVKWQLEHTRKLQEVFLLVMGLYDRLGMLDKHLAKSEASKAMSGEQSMCTSLIKELQQTRDGLLTLRAQGPTPHSETHSQETPGGCQRALTFPVHMKGTQANILPVDNCNFRAFTACIWANPTRAMEEAVLFSYCTEENGTGFQLYLSRGSVWFSVDSVEVHTQTGFWGKWTHYCGIWDGGSGNITLVANGQVMASRNLTAQLRTIPGGGAVQLGHMSAKCQVGENTKVPTAFSGKLTGFNLWDTAITEMKASLLLQNNGCDFKGNMVGWDVSPITVGAGVLIQ